MSGHFLSPACECVCDIAERKTENKSHNLKEMVPLPSYDNVALHDMMTQCVCEITQITVAVQYLSTRSEQLVFRKLLHISTFLLLILQTTANKVLKKRIEYGKRLVVLLKLHCKNLRVPAQVA
jgi:hypothetical protein